MFFKSWTSYIGRRRTINRSLHYLDKCEQNKYVFLNHKFKNNLSKEVIVKSNKLIELDNIFFNYPNKKNNVLNKFSLNIYKNEILGIKGKSGSGKSTLLNIIMGLISPRSGIIKFENKIINSQENLDYLRGCVSHVSQEIPIIKGSILENIIFPSENKFSMKEIEDAIKNAELQDMIDSLPNGINTSLTENGSQLSGGQRQRIALARAFLKEKKLLVLDEFTSSLDIKTESNILKLITKRKKFQSIIIVSHRESNLEICDRIIEL